MTSTRTGYVRQQAATRSACTYVRALQSAHLSRCYRLGVMNAAYQPRSSAAEAADGVAGQLGPDDQADNSHNVRIVLARCLVAAHGEPIWSAGRVSHDAPEAEMTG